MKIRVLSAADIERVLPMAVAIEAMKEAFSELAAGDAVVPKRLRVPVEEHGGMTLVKPALGAGSLGAKLVSVFPDNHRLGLPVTPGLVVALDRRTGVPSGICEGTYLTALRTGATVGAATEVLARRGAATAAVIGCGGQAPTQLLALAAVRDLASIRVYDRNPDRVEALVRQMQPRIAARIEPALDPDEAVAEADVVSTVTTSDRPVFTGSRIRPGTHVNGVGSFSPEMQEIDCDTVSRSRIFVDSLAAAGTEAGDLLIAESTGVTDRAEWIELGDVLTGNKPGRQSDAEVTLFKTVGVAIQDVTAAAWALERAEKFGVGQLIEL